jgi:hypothetical protein
MRPFVALWLQRRKRPKKKLREMNEKDDGTACASVAFDPSSCIRSNTMSTFVFFKAYHHGKFVMVIQCVLLHTTDK